ncbi:MAG TPA: hypothetical protein VFM69_01155, partial [Pricia sp.]|nr:hypothetical protein [Pricia sp.]
AHNNQRNPLIGGSSAPGTDFEIVNNIVYNHGAIGLVSEDANVLDINMINNYHINGSNSSSSRYTAAVGDGSVVYLRNNISYKRPSTTDPDIDFLGAISLSGNFLTEPVPSERVALTPFDFPLKDEPNIASEILLGEILDNAGTVHRNGAEQYVLNSLENGTGSLIDDPSEVGGYPVIPDGTIIADADLDGIPDSEEAEWGDDTFGYVNWLVDGTVDVPTVLVSEEETIITNILMLN